MFKLKKTITAVITAGVIAAASIMPVCAASHNPEEPTVLTLSEAYRSNAYYGNEYYTFTIDTPSDVNVLLSHVAINHTYTMTLSGNGIEPVSTNETSFNDELALEATLDAGTYYIEVAPDFFGTLMYRTEPDETWYNITVTACPL